MLDSLFLPVYTSTDQITASVYLVCSLASLALGAVIAFAAGFRSRQSKSFMLFCLHLRMKNRWISTTDTLSRSLSTV